MISCLLFAGCFKEEKPIQRRDRGPVSSDQVELGPTYDKEVYYSLFDKRIAGQMDKYSWHLSLSGNAGRPYIMLNTGKGMYAYKTDKSSLVEIVDTVGKLDNRLNDYPCGDPDSLALTGILTNGLVYVIDLGNDPSFQKEGYLLLKARIDSGEYVLEYSNIDGGNYHSSRVAFDKTFEHLFFNFKTAAVTTEPVANTWELLMTQYQHVYYNPFQTYSVVGCMINATAVTACEYIGGKNFNDINASDTIGCNFSSRRNIIGFGWKYYDLNNNVYIINPKKTYFVKHKLGNLFKLHFIGFYNSKGEKGTPSFEFQEL